MIVHIANPIYDSVFKYLMADERIARLTGQTEESIRHLLNNQQEA